MMKQFILEKGKNGKFVFWVTLATVVGASLLIIAMTDLFEESLFQMKYLHSYIMILFNTIMVTLLNLVYWRQR